MGYQAEIESGREAFSYLIRAWHERNGWSHRVLPALAEVLDLGRIHNSQVSMLRNRKLASPGPEVFLALGRINQWLVAGAGAPGAPLAGHPDLIEALGQGALPLLSDNGVPLGPGDLLEILGSSEDGAWYQVLLPDGRRGWVLSSRSFSTFSGDPDVVRLIEPPTLTPTETPTYTYTPSPTPTAKWRRFVARAWPATTRPLRPS